MVQNSLGAQWLATYSQSQLKGQMEYYIEPAEQTEEVKAQLAAITPDSLHPEELTLIDPSAAPGTFWWRPMNSSRPSTWSAATGSGMWQS